MYKAGRPLAAYDEFDGDESVFFQLISSADEDKNVDLMESLISVDRKRHANPKYLQYWRARAAVLKKDWKGALEILEQDAEALDKHVDYTWRARELHIQALLKSGANDEARAMAERHWKEEQYAFSLLTVAIVERNVAEAERWIEQLQKDGIYLPDLYTDELIAEGLQSDEFNSLREKYPELKAALEEKKE